MLQDKRDVADVAAESRSRQGPPSAARVGAPPRSPIGECRPRTYVPLCRLPASHVICSLLGWPGPELHAFPPRNLGRSGLHPPLLICQHAPSFTPLPLSPHSDVPTTCARASTVHRSTTPLHDRSSTTPPPSPDPTGRPNLYTLYHPQSMFRAVQVLNLTVPHPLDCVTRRHRE